MLLLLPAGPVLALADANAPTAEGLFVYAWRPETLQALFPHLTAKPCLDRPGPYLVEASRRELARAVNRQVAAAEHSSLQAMTAGDDVFQMVAADVLGTVAAFDWAIPTPSLTTTQPTAPTTTAAADDPIPCEEQAGAAGATEGPDEPESQGE